MAGNTALQFGPPSAALSIRGMMLEQDGRLLSEPLSFDLQPSTVTCLIGASGVGKSTLLLQIVEGLRNPTAGIVVRPGESATIFSMMSQQETLLPWLTVWENIAIARRLAGIRATVTIAQLLELVELAPLANRYPDELSGGEKQRVVLVRTLSLEAPLLLLDEPFGKLDPRLRRTLIARVREWVLSRGCTAFVVSHQLDDVAMLADRTLELRGFPATLEER